MPAKLGDEAHYKKIHTGADTARRMINASPALRNDARTDFITDEASPGLPLMCQFAGATLGGAVKMYQR